uniref:Uncharacterized protein n=1 Tax=Anguilla anguilla TaxID=7936 RepID=A0A0E9QW84_ANGAN
MNLCSLTTKHKQYAQFLPAIKTPHYL